jgi:hypothetical protein
MEILAMYAWFLESATLAVLYTSVNTPWAEGDTLGAREAVKEPAELYKSTEQLEAPSTGDPSCTSHA